MTALRLFTCGPYGARLTPRSCAQRFAPPRGRQSPGAGPRLDRIHCHECPVGAAHARGEDAPGVEYSLVEARAHVNSPPTPTTPPKARPMTATTETSRPSRPCAHPECDRHFVPSHSRSLYCNVHRTPEAAAARKALREELNAKLEGATEEAKTVTPESEPAILVRRFGPGAGEVVLGDAERWASSEELDEHELASAKANDELHVDEKGLGWVSCRWLLGYRTRALSRLRGVVERTKTAVGEAWTKDRPLDQAVQMKCNALERAAGTGLAAGTATKGACPCPSDHDEIDRLRGLADVQRERDELRDELHARAHRIKELEHRVDTLANASVPAELMDNDELRRADAEGARMHWGDGRTSVRARWLLDVRAERIEDFKRALDDARDELATEHAAAAERETPKTFAEAMIEAITPPPGVGAAAVLRAVGYQVVTVDSPRGPVIVVEGAI